MEKINETNTPPVASENTIPVPPVMDLGENLTPAPVMNIQIDTSLLDSLTLTEEVKNETYVGDISDLRVTPEVAEIDETSNAAIKEKNSDVQGSEIARVKSAYYGAFIKVIETVSPGLGSEDIVSIDQGKLVISKNNGIITCDLSNVFGKNSWNLKHPNMNLKLLKLIKGGDYVSIMDNGSQYIIFSAQGDIAKSFTTINKPDVTVFVKPTEINPGVLKSKFEVSKEDIINLIAAKTVLGGIYYNVTLDAETYELLNIDINDKHKEVMRSDANRKTIRYKTKELFPIAKPDALLLEVYSKVNEQGKESIYLRTISDVTMTTIAFTTPTILNEKRADLEVDLGI